MGDGELWVNNQSGWPLHEPAGQPSVGPSALLRAPVPPPRDDSNRTSVGLFAPPYGDLSRVTPFAMGHGEWLARERGRWWVLHTRARNEKHVAGMLAEQQVRHYLPLVPVRHSYAKSKATFHVPLFPGYVFLCGDHSDCDKARRTNRIANILYVDDQERLCSELRHICRVVERGEAVELFPALKAGQRCHIVRGALKGVEGVVARHGGRCRIYLSVSMLGQSAMVEVDAALLEIIDPPSCRSPA